MVENQFSVIACLIFCVLSGGNNDLILMFSTEGAKCWSLTLFFFSVSCVCEQLQAASVAQTAAKSIVDLKNEDEEVEPSKEKEVEDSAAESESEDENDKLRKSALDKLEKASEDSVFGQASCLRTELHNYIILSLMDVDLAFSVNATITVCDFSLAPIFVRTKWN